MKGYTNYNKTLTLDLRYGKLYLFYVPRETLLKDDQDCRAQEHQVGKVDDEQRQHLPSAPVVQVTIDHLLGGTVGPDLGRGGFMVE